MRIAVMGSGGLGGFFGGRLAAGGNDVSFVARGRHLEALRTTGLRIVGGPDAVDIPKVRAVEDPAEVGVADLVMICVKLWDTEAALGQIEPLVRPGTTLVSFQNGVMKNDYIRARYPQAHMLGGVGYVATHLEGPGVVRQTGPLQRLVFGELDGRPSAVTNELLEACLASGIKAEVSSDITRDIWEKYVFLVGLSATTTTIRLPIGPIRSDPRTRAFLHDIMDEVVRVGRAKNVNLPADYAAQRLRLADDVDPAMTSSMHHDLENGNRLEVRWLSGGVAQMAEELGLDTPLNRAVADILHLHAQGRADPS